MANFKTWVEVTRAGNYLVRHRDGKTKIPTGRWKIFTDYCIEKNESMVLDGKKLTGKQMANALSEKVMERHYRGELGAVDSTDSLEKLIEDYFEDKNHIAWKTRIHYEGSLKAMQGEFPSLNDLTKEKMIAWREKMKREGSANNTIHGILNDTRMFCNWLVYEKKIGVSPFQRDNPQDRGIVPSQTKPRPRFYTLEQFMDLEKAVAGMDHYAHVGMLLGHDYGLRKVEIVGDGLERLEGVLWEDLIWRKDGKVDLMIRPEVTKGKKKSRKIRIDQAFIELLGSRKTGPLVPITRSHFDHIVKKALEASGIKKMPGLFIHSFRHSFGKNFLQLSGSTQAALRDLLGHEDIKTTEIYSQFEQSYLDERVEKMAEQMKVEKSRAKVAGQITDISIKINDIK